MTVYSRLQLAGEFEAIITCHGIYNTRGDIGCNGGHCI